mmetsp:Transcript_33824/g.108120  ORF Transcript_33824/g.108120 Transcript_33824/m.108120 type:complete len:220 (-) Transcript_33824:594-1253(-)
MKEVVHSPGGRVDEVHGDDRREGLVADPGDLVLGGHDEGLRGRRGQGAIPEVWFRRRRLRRRRPPLEDVGKQSRRKAVGLDVDGIGFLRRREGRVVPNFLERDRRRRAVRRAKFREEDPGPGLAGPGRRRRRGREGTQDAGRRRAGTGAQGQDQGGGRRRRRSSPGLVVDGREEPRRRRRRDPRDDARGVRLDFQGILDVRRKDVGEVEGGEGILLRGE